MDMDSQLYHSLLHLMHILRRGARLVKLVGLNAAQSSKQRFYVEKVGVHPVTHAATVVVTLLEGGCGGG